MGSIPSSCDCSQKRSFFRALRHQDFDVCELSLSSFTVKTDRRDNPYVGIPVFPSRTFRHTSVFIRNDLRDQDAC